MKYKSQFQYIQALDVLRGFSILFVLLYHGSYGFVKGGWIGVDIFFILSGYLITSLLQAEYNLNNTINFSKFYWRRALRLLPALFACIFVANLLWSYIEQSPTVNRYWSSFGAIFYFTNLLNGTLPGTLSQCWSLSVEEHFYFLFPVLALAFLFKVPESRKKIYLVAIYVIICVFRIIISQYEDGLKWGVWSIDSNRFTFCKIDSIVLGVLLAYIPLPRMESDGRSSVSLICLLAGFVIIAFYISEFNPAWRGCGFILTDLYCMLACITVLIYSDHVLLNNKLFTWIGKRSYGIYLYHPIIFLYMENFRVAGSSENLIIVTILRFAVSFGVAALSYTYIEQPILKYKKRFETVKEQIQA